MVLKNTLKNMRNFIALLLALCMSCGVAEAQYYYLTYTNPGQNPGGLNTDGEFPVGGGLSGTWSTILSSSQPTGTYTSTQSIPFTFQFDSSAVTQYKVSNVGVLTFDVSTTKSPGLTNTSLPTNAIPDKSICVWGISGPGSNDNIVSKTFGSAPNRQHWVMFSSFDFNGNWSYWSIVLEETTNKIYVVDQRHQSATSGLTIGIQIDSTNAIEVTGSPNIATLAGGSSGAADNAYYEFSPGTQPSYDLYLLGVTIPKYPNIGLGSIDVKGKLQNLGSQNITSLDINYRVNGGSTVSQSLGLVSISPGGNYSFTHATPWTPSSAGSYSIEVWADNLNGNSDQNNSNDTLIASVVVSDSIPNIIDVYVTNIAVFDVVGTISNQVNKPMDLDFHPDLGRKELWVVNYGTENTGGSTVTFSNAGEVNQTSQYKQDGNAWHFMSLPTGIAFGENGDWANSPGVFDANHDGGNPFTGPALWSSDPAIYAQPSGGNGSHLDMLHASPYCMGIAHEKGNAYWVVDAYNNDIVRYDFAEDHGPGNSDHDDGEIVRVAGITVDWIDAQTACHLDLDKKSGWLYVVDGSQKRVIRLDINSGNKFGNPGWGPYETLAEYTNLNSVVWDVVVDSGLVAPAGLAVMGDRLLVGDHSNGEIVIYDVSSVPATELGRIYTGASGLMGITIGPEGHIWFVDTDQNQVVKINQGAVAIDGNHRALQCKMFPNPASTKLQLNWLGGVTGEAVMTIRDVSGKVVVQEELILDSNNFAVVDVEHLRSGTYFVELIRSGVRIFADKLVIMK